MRSRNLAMLLVWVAMAAGAEAPLSVVQKVDLDRYLGKWFEIASYPAWFARNCTGVTAEYSRPEGDEIKVVNRCYKGSLDGPLKEARGRAKVVDPETNAKLKVSFFGPFWGNYWILDLDPEYRWAVVGEPKRKYLWILSRTPSLEKDTLNGILSRLPDKGYDADRLQWTPQAENDMREWFQARQDSRSPRPSRVATASRLYLAPLSYTETEQFNQPVRLGGETIAANTTITCTLLIHQKARNPSNSPKKH